MQVDKGQMESKFINITFTAVEPMEGAIFNLKLVERFSHCVVVESVTDKGARCLEGYIRLNKKARRGGIQADLESACGGEVHFERGSRNKNVDIERYRRMGCSEWDRSSIAAVAMDVDERPEVRDTMADDWAKHIEAYAILRDAALQHDERLKLGVRMLEYEPQFWQKKAEAKLNTQDAETIHWYWDPVGGIGKTYLAKWLMHKYKAYYVPDIDDDAAMVGYQYQDYVTFDLTRSQTDRPPYDLIEKFKSGFLYHEDGCKFKADGAKVIVFSNWEPDASKIEGHKLVVTKLPEQDLWNTTRELSAISIWHDDSIFEDMPDLVGADGEQVAAEAKDLWEPPARKSGLDPFV